MTPRLSPERAFKGLTDAYQRHRPSYPPEVFAWLRERLNLRAGDRVVEPGAGTGIFTRLLLAEDLKVCAAELSHEMIGHLRGIESPNLNAVQARAEALPLSGGSSKAVIAAQAFHWFANAATLREWARVLEPGGGAAVLWNNRDIERSAFNREFEDLVRRHNPEHRLAYRNLPVEEIFAESQCFGEIERKDMNREWCVSAEEFVGFTHSVSYICNALGPARMPQFDADLRALLSQHFPDGAARIPLQCRAWLARRL
jgi:SAM-dependent methyltransferase